MVECTFGEVDMRWGIFWKPLKFSLETNALIIDASLRLHNFIVNGRIQTNLNNADVEIRSDIDIHREDIAMHMAQNPTGAQGIYGGEQEVRFSTQRGRPLQQEVESSMKGKEIRDKLRGDIATGNWVRPATNWYKEQNRTVMR